MTNRIRVPLGLCAAWIAAFELHVTVAPWLPIGPVKQVHVLVMGVAGALCLVRAASRREERLAWTLIGLGVLAWVAGESYYSFVLWNVANLPIPSPADGGYLLMPPLVFAGILSLLRARIRGLPTMLAVDGLIAALAMASVAAAWVLGAVLDVVGGTVWAVATNLAYPIADLILLGLIAGGVAASGWRVDRALGLLAAGVVSFWIADSYYLVTTASGSYTAGGIMDSGWWITALLVAGAAWSPPGRQASAVRHDDARVIVAPTAFAAVGLSVLVVASVTHVTLIAVVFAAASLLAVMARLLLTFAEHAGMLRSSRHEAATDALTGLGNRRALSTALERAFELGAAAPPMTLVLFDLDGFKHYNDTFGHPAGDTLLMRLGTNLAARIGEGESAFRMGGDEFCALLSGLAPDVDAAAAALSEHGDGFSIGCSHGTVAVPAEADDAESALRLADQRMYASKHGGRASAGRQSRDVLLRALAERDPDLGAHVDGVADLAEAVGRALGLEVEEVEQVRHAAELHDIGKVAIPDAILDKPGPLDETEWAFVRRHTIIGERIIAAAPALGAVARLVRSSHECWDGGGYPDGLAGERIPLGARIVAVCDAFDAMTSDRSYRAGMAPAMALAELRRCAGVQFDPTVVATFEEVWLATRRPSPAFARAAA